MNKYILILLFSTNVLAEGEFQCNEFFDTTKLENCEYLDNAVEQYNLGINYKNNGDLDRAFYWINKAANGGILEAKFNLAWFYETGTVVEKNQSLAFKYMQELYDLGYLPAANNLGQYYQKGIGVKKDLKQAILFYQKAIDGGLPSIPYINLAYAYFYGLGIEKEPEKAISLILPLADNGDVLAMTNLGTFYKELNNIKQSIFWTTKAAEIGGALAQANLGLAYAKGIGVKINREKSIYWLNKSMNQNNSQAFFIMGTLYSEGDSILGKDEEMAFSLYLKSAKLGNGNAQNNLGNWLFNGRYVLKNEKEALKWYLKAAEENDMVPSMYALYQIYSQGTKEIPQDLEKAKYWLEKAKENGFSPK